MYVDGSGHVKVRLCCISEALKMPHVVVSSSDMSVRG